MYWIILWAKPTLDLWLNFDSSICTTTPDPPSLGIGCNNNVCHAISRQCRANVTNAFPFAIPSVCMTIRLNCFWVYSLGNIYPLFGVRLVQKRRKKTVRFIYWDHKQIIWNFLFWRSDTWGGFIGFPDDEDTHSLGMRNTSNSVPFWPKLGLFSFSFPALIFLGVYIYCKGVWDRTSIS